jgi:hypothetical protein
MEIIDNHKNEPTDQQNQSTELPDVEFKAKTYSDSIKALRRFNCRLIKSYGSILFVLTL